MPSSQSDRVSSRIVVDWQVEETLEEKLDLSFMERVLAEALRDKLAGETVQLGIAVTTDEEIRDINRRFRGKDSATDVLSFPLQEYLRPEELDRSFPLPPGEPQALGDIIISYPRAKEQAHTYGHSLERELAFLLVHGLMHLLGYDHEDPADQQLMRREEERALERLNLKRTED